MTNTVELIRGEMRLWSDLGAAALRPAPRGRVAAALLDRAIGDAVRVLVVGPHDPTLLAGLVRPGRDLTVVVRSVSDAEVLQGVLPQARVVCGGLEAFADGPVDPFDAVVALDGVERVLSNDSPELDFTRRLDLVRSFVADAGVLVCSVDNPMSLLDLADARPAAERRDTGDWEPPAGADPTRPGTLAAAHELLGGSAYSAFPLVTAPLVLAASGGDAVRDLRVRRALADGSAALAGRDLFFDPTRQLQRAIAAGVADAAAPGWIFVVGASDLPEVLLEDHPSRAHSLVRAGSSGQLEVGQLEVVSDPAGSAPVEPVAGQPLPQGPAAPEAPAPQPVDPAALTRGEVEQAPVPGELLTDRLRRLSLTEDLPGLRALMGSYLAWVATAADPAHAVFLTADNVALGADDAFAAVDASYALAASSGALSADVAVARVALDTARVLLDPGLRRIWPPWMGVAQLGRALQAMAGAELDEETWQLAAALDESLANTRSSVLDEDVQSLRTLVDELRYELWSARGLVFAHERITGLRDKQLEARSNKVHELVRRTREAEQAAAPDVYSLISLRRGSKAFKAAKAVRHPGMVVRWIRTRRDR